MKTQVNKFQKEQALNNTIMLISILVFGAVLLTIVGKDLFRTNYSVYQSSVIPFNSGGNELTALPLNEVEEEKELVPNKLVPILADLSSKEHVVLEKGKLAEKVQQANNYTYQSMINFLADVEEPELLIEDVMPTIKAQRKYMVESEQVFAIVKVDAYLNELYKQKNEQVFSEIQAERLYTENVAFEEEMEVEQWMITDLTLGKYIPEVEPTLALQLKEKNESIARAIELSHQYKEYLAVETEEPLEVEHWMVDARCWCPEEKKKDNWYKEWFAMNNK